MDKIVIRINMQQNPSYTDNDFANHVPSHTETVRIKVRVVDAVS